MKSFMQLAEGLDFIPIQHYGQIAGPGPVREGTDAVGAWMECPQIRGLILDVGRRVDAVEVGEACLLMVPPGEVRQLALAGGGATQYYTAVVKGGPGAQIGLGEESVPAHSGALWWTKALPLFTNNSSDDLWVLSFAFRLDV